MVGLMPDHVLEKKDWVVVVEIHLLSGRKPAFYRVPHRPGALIQHLLDTSRITLCTPLFFRYFDRKFRSIFLNENETHIMNVGEKLSNRWAALHRSDRQSLLRQRAKQVYQNSVAAVPGIEQSFEQLLIWRARHLLHPAIQLSGIVMQDHVRELESTVASDLMVIDHSGEGDGQGLAPGMRGLPADHVPINLRRVGIEVRAEEHFFRIPLQPLPDHLTQCASGNQPGLLGEISIDVGLHEQVCNIFCEGPGASVKKNEIGFAQSGIVEYGIEQNRI